MSYTPRAHYGLWLNGQEVPGQLADIPIEDPSNGNTIAHAAAASAEDVDKAITLAQETFKKGTWSRMSPPARAAVVSLGCLSLDGAGGLSPPSAPLSVSAAGRVKAPRGVKSASSFGLSWC